MGEGALSKQKDGLDTRDRPPEKCTGKTDGQEPSVIGCTRFPTLVL